MCVCVCVVCVFDLAMLLGEIVAKCLEVFAKSEEGKKS